MSSDPASYIHSRAGTGRHIALTLRGPLHEHHTTYEIPREDALRLFSDLGRSLFATASLEPRPARQAEPAPGMDKPTTDNDEIDTIVGALAALTDRVSALEERPAHMTDVGTRKLSGPVTFRDGQLWCDPAAIPPACWTTKEARSVTDEPASPAPLDVESLKDHPVMTGVAARVTMLESQVIALDASISSLACDVEVIKGSVAALEGRQS